MKHKLVMVPADKIEEVKELVKTETEDSEKEEKKMKTGVKVFLSGTALVVATGIGYAAAKLFGNKDQEEDEFESRDYVEVNPVEPDTQDAAD